MKENGAQRSRGFELELAAQPSRRLYFLAAYGLRRRRADGVHRVRADTHRRVRIRRPGRQHSRLRPGAYPEPLELGPNLFRHRCLPRGALRKRTVHRPGQRLPDRFRIHHRRRPRVSRRGRPHPPARTQPDRRRSTRPAASAAPPSFRATRLPSTRAWSGRSSERGRPPRRHRRQNAESARAAGPGCGSCSAGSWSNNQFYRRKLRGRGRKRRRGHENRLRLRAAAVHDQGESFPSTRPATRRTAPTSPSNATSTPACT